MRARRIILWSIPALLLLLVLAVAWLIATQPGLRFALARAQAFTPLELAVGEANGRLIGPLELRDVTLETDAMRVQVPRVELDWRPWRLAYKREVRVLRLDLYEPLVRLLDHQPDDDPMEPTDLPDSIELPVHIELDRIRVHGGRVLRGDEVEVKNLALDLSATWRERRIELRHLEVGAMREDMRVELSADGVLHTDQAGRQALDLAWRLDLPEQAPPLRGTTRLRGTLAALEVEQQLSGLVEAQLAGTVRALTEAPAWDLRLQVEPLPESASLWPEELVAAAADLRLRGDVERSHVTGKLAAPGYLPVPVTVDITGGWAEGTARIEEANLAIAETGGITLRGELTPEDAMAGEFELALRNLTWPLDEQDDPLVRLALVTITASGRDEAYDFELQARGSTAQISDLRVAADGRLRGRDAWLDRLVVADADGLLDARGEARMRLGEDDIRYLFALAGEARIPDQPVVTLDVAGTGDTSHVVFERLRVDALEGQAEGAGQLGWADGAVMDFTLSLRDINPGSHFDGWTGRLAAELTLQGELGETPALSAALTPISGTLRNRDVTGDVRVSLEGEELSLHNVELAIGSARVQATGTLGDMLAVEFNLAAPNLQALHPEVHGAMDARGRVGGTREAPALRLAANGSELRYEDWLLAALDADIDVDLAEATASSIEVRLTDLRGEEDVLLNALELTGGGTRAEHRLALAGRRGESAFGLELGGGLDQDERWSGLLQELSLALAEDLVWQLQQPSALSISGADARLDNACMDGELGRLCVAGDWRGGAAWHGELSIAAFDLEGLTRWVGNGLIAQGTLAGAIVIDADERGFTELGGGLGVNAGAVFLAEQPDDILLSWQSAALGLEGDLASARGELNIDLAADDQVAGRFEIGWNDEDLPLEATLRARIRELGLIAELVPDLAALRGEMGADFTVTGTVTEPRLAGSLFWENGAAQVPVLGIAPRDITATVDLEADAISFELTALSGDGTLQSAGNFTFADGFAGNASLTGRNLLVMDLPEARVLASPTLGLLYQDMDLQVNGVVEIPTASITGILRGTGAVSESPDTVIVGQRAVREEPGLNVGYAVRINIGPDVSVDVAGLRGRIEGSLLAIQRDDGVATGRGDLRVVDGSFGAFGQRLTIEEGRLLFTGGVIENPGLDIRAVRQIDDSRQVNGEVRVGALVRGTLNEPEISLFSAPSMPRAEILSYITVGKGINDLDTGEQDALNSAANSLALSGGNLLAREIGGRLGLDQLTVEEGADPGSAALVIGQFLGPRLFVSYGVGLFDAVNELRVRYTISRRWALEAASGDQSSADLFYSVER